LIKKLKIFVRIFIGPLFWARNIIYEWIYFPRIDSKIEGLDCIASNGFYVYPEKLDIQSVSRLKKDFDDLQILKPFDLKGQLSGRLYEHGPISQLSEHYINKFMSTAKAYFGSDKVRCELTMYQKSWPKDSIDDLPGGEFHEDDNKRNLKFFIYLTDVNEDNGPFCYVPKTHSLRKHEKYIRWFLWEVFHTRKYLYSFKLDQKQCELDEVKVTGSAGTVFCADTTGYHRASAPLIGERQVFVVSYTRI
jgi:hypothetical protein